MFLLRSHRPVLYRDLGSLGALQFKKCTSTYTKFEPYKFLNGQASPYGGSTFREQTRAESIITAPPQDRVRSQFVLEALDREQHQNMPVEMPTANTFSLSDGRQMAYKLSGDGADTPVVLLSNSLAQDMTAWDLVVPVIEQLGFRVLRYDQPGHGVSDAPADSTSMTFEIMSDDVASLLRHLGLSKLHAWIGDSMGGIKGVYFVARHPGIIHKLVVADAISSAPVVAGNSDVFAARAAAAKEANSMAQDLENTRKRWFGDNWMAANPEETSRIISSMQTTTVKGLEACCAALSDPSFDLRKHYPSVGAGCDRAMIIAGEKDADLPIKMQAMRSAIEESLRNHGKNTQVEMEIIENAGHVPYVDGFGSFCQVVAKFLQA